MSLKIRFRFDGRCAHHPRDDRSAMDIHPMGSVKGVSLCTLFTFTRRSPKEEPKTQTSS
jgi:hypothetical protein